MTLTVSPRCEIFIGHHYLLQRSQQINSNQTNKVGRSYGYCVIDRKCLIFALSVWGSKLLCLRHSTKWRILSKTLGEQIHICHDAKRYIFPPIYWMVGHFIPVNNPHRVHQCPLRTSSFYTNNLLKGPIGLGNNVLATLYFYVPFLLEEELVRLLSMSSKVVPSVLRYWSMLERKTYQKIYQKSTSNRTKCHTLTTVVVS